MNSVERFYATVERKATDRPACWLGVPTEEATVRLCEFYGVQNGNELKRVCGDDIFSVEIPYRGGECNALHSVFDWYMGQRSMTEENRTLTADGCFADCESIEDIEKIGFKWPDARKGISLEECRKVLQAAPGDKAILGMVWAGHFQQTCAAFGMENALANMLTEPEIVHYVDDRVVDFYEDALRIFWEATNGKIDAVLIGDDMGRQQNLMISPELVKEFVIPGTERLVRLAHSYKIKVIYHSCGSILDAIPLLLDIGIDVLHPIQAKARGMDVQNLKEKFGDELSFCGGVDTQELLPHASEEEIRKEVARLRALFPSGLILSPSHEAVQKDVPPESIKAMLDEATRVYE